MSEQLPNITDFRSMVVRGQSAVLAEWQMRPDDAKIKAALSQYDDKRRTTLTSRAD
jgi:hypothetical protein